MGKTAATVIRDGLQGYADRGVFRSFAENATRKEKLVYQFIYIGNRMLSLEFTPKNHTLVLRNLLPRVSADLYADLNDFIGTLYDSDLPKHRRIHKGSAEVQMIKNRGNVSVVFQVKRNRYAYGVNKLVNLISWIQTHLQLRHPDYLVEVLGEPNE